MTTSEVNMEYRASRRSDGAASLIGFAAVLLIGIGATWILAQTNVLTGTNLAVALRMWPVVLIAVGLTLLFGRASRVFGAIIGLLTLFVMGGLVVAAPAFGWIETPEVRTTTLQSSLGETESVQVNMNLSIGDARIYPLVDSDQLIDANISHLGEMEATVTGEAAKVITLREQYDGVQVNFGWLNWFGDSPELSWNVGLNNRVPMNVSISGGVGSSVLDFSGFTLTNFELNSGVGETELLLPLSVDGYNASVNTGVGGLEVTLVGDGGITLAVSGGVGETVLNLAEDAAVRLEFDGGLGEADVPSWLRLVSGEGDNADYESAAYDEASPNERITITVDGGIGGLVVR
jgi:hypothetical protein